jgi:PLP dependent protein
MPVHAARYETLRNICAAANAKLVAVSKTKPIEDIEALYAAGQRHFGENYVQELVDKQAHLPIDIHWHFIGHLQSNKVKLIAPFVHLIHGVDSFKLLQEINRQGQKTGKPVNCLLQVHIASEETKFGFSEHDLFACLAELRSAPEAYWGIKVAGLMGMASLTENELQVQQEFRLLKQLFDTCGFNTAEHVLSMGMSGDYTIALKEGANLIRIGSLLFGERN